MSVADERVYVISPVSGYLVCYDTFNGARIWSSDLGNAYAPTPTVADDKVYLGSRPNLYCLDASTGVLDWTFPTRDPVSTSPTVVGGRVYFGSWDNNIYCVHASTGSLIWNFTTGNSVRSSPAITDGRVFVGSMDQNLYCLDASTGVRVWNYTTGRRIVSATAVADGRVFAGSEDGWIFCVDAITGSEIWKYSTNVSNPYFYSGRFSSPAVFDGRVYFGDNGVYCLDAGTGEKIWDYATSTWVYSSPTVADGKVYATSYDGRLLCLNSITGGLIWSYRRGNRTHFSPAIADGVLYMVIRDNSPITYSPFGGMFLVAFSDEHDTGKDWPMHRHDISRSGYSPYPGPTVNTTLWTFEAGNNVFSSPTTSNGKTYFGCSDGILYCLNSTSGALIWDYTIGRTPHSPTLFDDMVYVGSSDQRIYCLNADTGEHVWDFRTGYYVDASPVVHNGMVYVGSWDYYFYCLDASTGALLWKFEAKDSFDDSSAAISGNRIYVGCTDNRLLCLDASSGVLVWEFNTGGGIHSSPAIYDDNVYFGSMDCNVYCLNAMDGTLIWNYPTGDVVLSSPAVAKGCVYIGSGDNHLYCLNSATGTLIWRYNAGGGIISSPALANEAVYFGSEDGKVHCLDAVTGGLIWEYETDDRIFSSPAVADGCVYIGSFDNKVYAFGGEGDEDDGDGGGSFKQRIYADPSIIDYGRVPIDYPRQRNTTIITSIGTEPLRIESVTLTEDGMGVFSYLGFLYDGRYISAYDGATGPFVLGPGEYLQLLVDYQTITADVGDYHGAIEIRSDDPTEPTIEIQLLAIGATHSGATTYWHQTESQAYVEHEQLHFEEPIHLNAVIITSDIFSEHNIEDSDLIATEDMRGVIVEGTVKDPYNFASMTIEITYTNSSEKLAVVNLIISPYPATNATISTCDLSGNHKDVFYASESVYVTGEGFQPSREYFVNLVQDFEIWLSGMPIQRIQGSTTQVSSNPDGVIPPTILWDNPPVEGEFDIILDINGNGVYDGDIDPLDNSDRGSTGGLVVLIPEPWMILSLLLLFIRNSDLCA